MRMTMDRLRDRFRFVNAREASKPFLQSPAPAHQTCRGIPDRPIRRFWSMVSRQSPIAYTCPLTRRWMPVPKIDTVPSGFSVDLSNPRSEVWIDVYGLVNVSLRLGWLVTSRVSPFWSRNSVTRMCPVVGAVTGKPQAALGSGSRPESDQNVWSLPLRSLAAPHPQGKSTTPLHPLYVRLCVQTVGHIGTLGVTSHHRARSVGHQRAGGNSGGNVPRMT
jgi:hypothetical protein